MGLRWIYHATEEPKIIDSNDFESYKEDGWCDTPAAFINLKDFGIDTGNDLQVQQVGESIAGVVDALNGGLNVDEMDKDDLEAYALKHFQVDIDKRKVLFTLRKQVRDLIEGKEDVNSK